MHIYLCMNDAHIVVESIHEWSTYVHARIYIHVCIYMYICIYVYTYIYVHVHIYEWCTYHCRVNIWVIYIRVAQRAVAQTAADGGEAAAAVAAALAFHTNWRPVSAKKKEEARQMNKWPKLLRSLKFLQLTPLKWFWLKLQPIADMVGWHKILKLFVKLFKEPEFCHGIYD